MQQSKNVNGNVAGQVKYMPSCSFSNSGGGIFYNGNSQMQQNLHVFYCIPEDKIPPPKFEIEHDKIEVDGKKFKRVLICNEGH